MSTLCHVGPVIPAGGGGGGGGTGLATYVSVTAGENIDAGAPVSLADLAGVPRAYEADANGTGTRPQVFGVAVLAITAGAVSNIQVAGETAILVDAIWDAVPAVTDVGKPVYLSNIVGQLTITAPATAIQVGWVSVGGAGATKIIVSADGASTPTGTAAAPNLIQSGEAEVYNSTTPLVLAGFYLHPTTAGYVAGDTQIVFRVVAANGVAGLTNHVELYNVTDGAAVHTFNVTLASTVKQEYICTVPADLPVAEKVYEVRAYLGAAPTLPTHTINVYSWAIELQAI